MLLRSFVMPVNVVNLCCLKHRMLLREICSETSRCAVDMTYVTSVQGFNLMCGTINYYELLLRVTSSPC
jgi:hypothetical protein